MAMDETLEPWEAISLWWALLQMAHFGGMVVQKPSDKMDEKAGTIFNTRTLACSASENGL